MRGLRWLIPGAVVGFGAAAAHAGDALRPGEFSYQYRDDVVLSAAASAQWGSGPYRLEAVPDDRSDQIVVSRGVDPRRLPTGLARWRGRTLQLHAWDGSACTAAVIGFQLVGVARLSPAQAVAWNALRDPAKGDPVIGDSGWQDQPAMAEAAWNQGEHFLVAMVDRKGRCAAQAWARDAELPDVALAVDEPLSEPLRALAIERFRALPAWQRLQQAYTRAPDHRGEPEPSWDRQADAQPHVQIVQLASDHAERRLVSVYAVHDDPAAARDRRLWAIFDLDGPPAQPTLLLRSVATGRGVPAEIELQAVVELRRDGHVALLYSARTGNGLMLEQRGTLMEQPAQRAPR
ncbi:MAG TPA: hypothetical protein VFK02_05530 [Kofleriaceae bacterium]|nr:hypothetical protein [Kofleriaceae bacterium]